MGGSLKGRVVVDLVGIGPEFLALTSDGVIHEWNSYLPYLNRLSGMDPELIVPTCMERPKIPEPIEWTPTFQKRVRKKKLFKKTLQKNSEYFHSLTLSHLLVFEHF